MTLVIKAVPPSLNRFAGRENRWEYRKVKAEWTEAVMLAARGIEPVRGKARVTITYHFPDRRRRDPDNYAGKVILDGLTKAGVIEDDDFAHIELVLKCAEPGSPRTVIDVAAI